MVFGVTLLGAVELGTPTGPERHGQSEGPQRIPDGVADRVDSRRVFQGPLGFGLYLGMFEFSGCLMALALIARHTGQREIRGAAEPPRERGTTCSTSSST
jgi:hypothetical protein